MDDPACDADKLRATYAQFATVNAALAGWRGIYERYLRPRLAQGATLLDIGCGGGDVLRRLAHWTRRDGLSVALTGADPDERALQYARAQANPPEMRFLQADAAALLARGERFDVVVSNHLLHHLRDAELLKLCRACTTLSRNLVLHSDIRRSDLAYLGYSLTRPLFRNSFITEDGLLSIRRSFVPQELEHLLPPGWEVKTTFPYRNLVMFDRAQA